MAIHLDQGAMDLHVTDRDLRNVLAEVFMLMGARYHITPEVQGTVTLDVHNATYAQVLDLLLGEVYMYSLGPHDTIYIHRRGTTWRPGWEEAA